MVIDAATPAEEVDFEAIMNQARTDAWGFGISEGFKAYLDQSLPFACLGVPLREA